MNEDLRSILLAPAGLYLPLIAAVVLTLVRTPRRVGRGAVTKLAGLFLVGIAIQCLHFVEEFSTRLYEVFPPLLGLVPVPANVFVAFNLVWIGIWAVSAYGILRGVNAAYFPVWFFGLAMCLNGVIHPLLSIWTGGYFPGLITSPLSGLVGILVIRQLFRTTETAAT